MKNDIIMRSCFCKLHTVTLSLASSPGHSKILSRVQKDKTWEWPGNRARLDVQATSNL